MLTAEELRKRLTQYLSTTSALSDPLVRECPATLVTDVANHGYVQARIAYTYPRQQIWLFAVRGVSKVGASLAPAGDLDHPDHPHLRRATLGAGDG